MAADRQLKHGARAIALLSGIALPRLSRPGGEQPPFPPPTAVPRVIVAGMPRLHQVATPRKTSRRADPRLPAARNEEVRGDWNRATGQIPHAEATGADHTPPPYSDSAPPPPGSAHSPGDRLVPQLVVCDPNARGLPSAADAIQE